MNAAPSATTPPEAPTFGGTVHLVFSSHWDREWYLPFQKFRGNLVQMLDEVLAHLESGALPVYQLDGQFIPVEDYLAIRPGKEAVLRELVAAGRFRVGPWYNLPDEFLVSGESLVRNLVLGMRRSEAFGQTSKVGWLCDLFGHNSQLPQVCAQLGIESIILWRGAAVDLGANFHWRSPDGTEILVHRFPENGYSDFGFDVRGIAEPKPRLTLAEMLSRASGYLEKTVGLAQGAQNLLWFDGADHIEFDPMVLEVAARLNAQAGREMVRIASLDDFTAALRAENLHLKTAVGELREPASMDTLGWLIPGVGSSRIPLKQANHAGETLLTLWAEPWCARANFLLGSEYPAQALELAWEYLLKNHPHDSICGCSPDETHAAMPYRFDQSRQIAEYHMERVFQDLSVAALHGRVGADELGLSVFAAAGSGGTGDSSSALQRTPEILVPLTKNWPKFNEFFGFEAKPSLKIYNLAGEEIAYQLLQVVPSAKSFTIRRNRFPAVREGQVARLALDLPLPPGAAEHLIVKRAEGPTRLTQQGAIGVGRDRLRNKFLEVTAAGDGTISLLDLPSGAEYRGLLALEDTADIGDGWFHGMALQDRALLSTGGTTTCGLTENGALLARLQIRTEWPVPAEFDFARNERSTRLTPLVVEHRVTLRKDSVHVEIETTVHNQARDHRLRLLCPSGLAGAQTFWADTPFDAVERLIALRADNHLLRELQVEMTPQQNWVAVGDGTRGLAVLAPGQYESAVLDQPDRPLCVTLLRAFRRAVFTGGNDGGQIQGVHKFQLALKPFGGGSVPATELYQLAQSIAAPARSVVLEGDFIAEFLSLETGKSLADDCPRISGPVVLSASFQSQPGEWTFRVFNPKDESVMVQMAGGTSWRETDFRGENARKIQSDEVAVAPRKIVTLQASF